MSEIDELIKDYIDNFINSFSQFLKESIAFSVIIYPYNVGVIFKLQFVHSGTITDIQTSDKVETLKDALETANLKVAGYKTKDLDNPDFAISNIILNEDSIFIFKKYKREELTEMIALNDVKKIIHVLA